ncbi:MAG: tetratricopeptide repeat protein, partial [Vicinamibacterales bacterium]
MVQRLAARLLSTALALLALATPLRAELTNGRALAAVYDSILAGRFTAAEQELKAACPPAPAEACQAMAVTILWWRISLNPENQELDEEIERNAVAAIDAAERWTRREPDNAEAWFYHAAAHAPLVQWRLLREQRLTAIREASRVKSSLERALELDPTLQDAHFGIGLYRYYAGIAPAALRMFRWLFWLPGGDREEGLEQMERARQSGQLLGGEADYQLHFIYLWYENQHARALELLENLHQRYPTNPLFLERIAEVQREYFNDYPASLAAWRTLVADAERNAMALPQVAQVRGRLGLASTLDEMYRTDRAIDVLQQLVAARPADPPHALARAYLQLGAAHDRLGQRDSAVTAYAAAIREARETKEGDAIRELATEGTRRAPDRASADAYRLSLDGL